ncbi:protein kinase [Stieleria mannarensis]|uniref:protein kinase n=1 Tax=Stieleria mannarensis TaxID=2755585 RepID=UPI0016019224|nr:protein kinase [Rhodopirellula sp. JC639]
MRRVLKIGGSLLLRESLAGSIQSWVASQPPAQTIAIVGGGELIDAVRRLDAMFPSPPAWVHWQCVGLLRTTFEWLGRQLDPWQLESTAKDFGRMKRQHDFGNHLVAVDAFYHAESISPLPEDWTTTTDAIAGWLSILTDADELVLLKSCDVDDSLSLDELAQRQIVDAALPNLADRLPPLRLVNFAAEAGR